MNEKATNSLVERYYRWERNTWCFALLLIIWHFFGLIVTTGIPWLKVALRDPTKFPHVVSLILVISLLFTFLEWKQSDQVARQATLSRIRFAFTIIASIVAVWLNVTALTERTALAGVSGVWYLLYLCLGIAIAGCSSTLAIATLMITPKNEARARGLPRIPIATRCTYFGCGLIMLALFAGFSVANRHAPVRLLPIALWITGLPVVATLFGKRPRISELREIASTHHYLYFLNNFGRAASEGLDISPNSTPRQQQEAIRHHLAQNSGDIALRPPTVDLLKAAEDGRQDLVEEYVAKGCDVN